MYENFQKFILISFVLMLNAIHFAFFLSNNVYLKMKWKLKYFWADLREEYPLNLSILLSGGQETNKDSPSTGEGSGNSSSLKSESSGSELWPMEISPWWGQVQVVVGIARPRGLKPRSWSDNLPYRKVFRESCCSGLQH